jgi:TnpA family transposase
MKAVRQRTLKNNLDIYFDYVVQNEDIIVVPRHRENDAFVIMSRKQYDGLVKKASGLSLRLEISSN